MFPSLCPDPLARPTYPSATATLSSKSPSPLLWPPPSLDLQPVLLAPLPAYLPPCPVPFCCVARVGPVTFLPARPVVVL